MLKVNYTLGMPKLERSSKNSGKREMIIEELVIVKVSEDLVQDHCLLRQMLVDQKVELELKLKKSLMKVSIIVQKD